MLYNHELYPNDFANIVGTVSGLIVDFGEFRVYELHQRCRLSKEIPRPPLVRVMVDTYLKKGSIYSIQGVIDSVNIDARIVPVLSAGKVTILEKSGIFNKPSAEEEALTALITKKESVLDNMLFSNFFHVDSLTVVNKIETDNTKILVLKKANADSKFLYLTNLHGICKFDSETQFNEVSIGDKISVLGYIYRDLWKESDKTGHELGVRFIQLNPDFLTVNRQQQVIELTHEKRYKKVAIEELLEYVK